MTMAPRHSFSAAPQLGSPPRLSEMSKQPLRFTVIIAVAYLLALAMIAFWPTPVDRPVSGRLCNVIGWLHAHGMPSFIGYDNIEFGANILLFTPFGYIAAAWTGKWWHALSTGFAASCIIELGQALILPNRVASLLDILANTMGAVLGALILTLVNATHRRHQRLSGSGIRPGTGAQPDRESTVHTHSSSVRALRGHRCRDISPQVCSMDQRDDDRH